MPALFTQINNKLLFFIIFSLPIGCFAQINRIVAPDKDLQKLLDSSKTILQKGQPDTAEMLLQQLIIVSKQKGSRSIEAQARISIGRIQADKGENVKALKHYQDALTVAEHIHDKSLIAHVYKNIGALYISWKKFSDALNNYNKAEMLAAETGEEELVADCQNNKGTVYEQQQHYSAAINAYKKALDIYRDKKITAKISMSLSNLAIVYKFQKNYSASLKYNLQALALSTKTGDKWMMSATLNNIGNLYGEMGQYAKAINYCEKAIKLAKLINAIEIVESTYDSMANAAAKAGDFKNAFVYHQLFSEANGKFINAENTRQLAELNVKYETERKQKLIQQQQFEISKKNIYLYGFVLLSILVAVVAYLVVRNYKYRQETYLQQQLYKQQALATKALFEGEQKERIRIARDLHDSIGQMLAVVRMNLSNYHYQNNPAVDKTLELVDETIVEVRNISHNLIPEELNFGLVAAIDELCNQLNMAGLTNASLTIHDGISDVKLERGNELSLYRIVQEILSNMVKHAKATKVDIVLKSKPGHMNITIQDNGKGFDTSIIHQSEGIGWKNIAARAKLLDAGLQIISNTSTGTAIDITLPV